MRTLVFLALSLSTSACAPHVVRAHNALPAEFQLKLSKVPRVWIAGFATGTQPEFDVSMETVRLLRAQLRTWSSADVIEAEPVRVDTPQRLSDVAFWRRLGEEHGRPLIVSGTVRLLIAPTQVVQRGARAVYLPSSGRVLEATVVTIDGTSGKVLSTQMLPRRMRYGLGRFSSALALFFQMMDQAMPDWFAAIAGAPPIHNDPDHS